MSTEGGMKAVFAALAANLGVAIAKFVAFVLTGSSSMLSEAIHSVADSGNQVLLLVGNKRSRRKRDEEHQFGYGRLRYVYAFIVSIVLFLVGGLFSLYEGFHKIQHPEELSDPTVAFVVLFAALGLEGFSLRTALKEANRSRGKHGLLRFVRRTRQPELPVILLEDIGALIGLMFALFGISMAVITGDGRWDGLGAAAVGALLVVIAVFLAFEMSSMLTGESALPEDQIAVRNAIAATAGVSRVIHLRTLHLGPDELLVGTKIAVAPNSSGAEIADIINAAEVAIRAVVKMDSVIFVEPDIFDPQRAASDTPPE
ncbi:MAG: cation diffusion facilitator family transporter [Actinomycetia bacterium]|nr:cation diffusion facilitator family transporter [Actinomycetes bacterium]